MSGFVAPYVGAWIETLTISRSKTIILSHPMWVRGLKQEFWRFRVISC